MITTWCFDHCSHLKKNDCCLIDQVSFMHIIHIYLIALYLFILFYFNLLALSSLVFKFKFASH